MSGELQSIVDELAERLGRSVVIDDPGIQLLCASRHYGDEDPVRVHTVLQRTAGSETIAYVLGQSPDRWPGSGMLAGSETLGLLPRLCVPLREQGVLLGYLMIIDGARTLTPDEIEATERYGRAAAAEMYTDRVSEDAERALAASALHDLLGGDAAARAAAQHRLVHDRLLRDAPSAVVTVLEIDSSGDTAVRVEIAHRTALRAFAESTTVRSIVDADRSTLLQLRPQPATGEELRAQAVRMLETVRPLLAASAKAVVGVGGPAAGLDDAWVSHREAALAARAARRAPGLAGVGVWPELGELAILAQLPDDALPAPTVTGPLRALAEHDGGARLRETLRCFLDNGGSVPRTAAALHLHRTSLYYRLGQIRDITGVDLDDGRARLLLHLGLRLDDLGFPTE
jgi:PucR C-terminal helix-turn-helix domain/GGDEF-like domain